jgi:hypothetical protein
MEENERRTPHFVDTVTSVTKRETDAYIKKEQSQISNLIPPPRK